MIYDSRNFLHYYRVTPDGRMLFGGRAAFFPENAQTVRRSGEILRRGMVEVYPQLRDARIEYVWGGTLDFAFDIMPHAGQIDGMYYALGYAGHGVAMATYQGQKIAELMAGDQPENPFVGIPFPGAAVVLAAGGGVVQVLGLGELKPPFTGVILSKWRTYAIRAGCRDPSARTKRGRQDDSARLISRSTPYTSGPSTIAMAPPMVAMRSPPSSATMAIRTGAATTYSIPARRPGTTKERGKSGRVRRSFQPESTVSTVVAERSQM
jgi:hypothetical protein